ncbi:hypothetical protein C9426_30610 [Serratia sp. S1B]|nr:hypothetical protein C9426_30610 [Serratia sp. S1B]
MKKVIYLATVLTTCLPYTANAISLHATLACEHDVKVDITLNNRSGWADLTIKNGTKRINYIDQRANDTGGNFFLFAIDGLGLGVDYSAANKITLSVLDDAGKNQYECKSIH